MEGHEECGFRNAECGMNPREFDPSFAPSKALLSEEGGTAFESVGAIYELPFKELLGREKGFRSGFC